MKKMRDSGFREECVKKILDFQDSKAMYQKTSNFIKTHAPYTQFHFGNEQDIGGIESRKSEERIHYQQSKEDEDAFEIDDVVSRKEENFYLKKQDNMNIFQYCYQDQTITIGNSLLEKHNFCFTSIMTKIQKVKLPAYRDLSRFGRRMMLGLSTGSDKRDLNIDSYESSFNLNELRCADVLSIASGRFTPKTVIDKMNMDGENYNKESSETSSEDVPGFENDMQEVYTKTSLKVNINEDKEEIRQYLKMEQTEQEKEYERQCKNRKEILKAELKRQEYLFYNTIFDEEVHAKLEREINKYYATFAEAKSKQPKSKNSEELSKNKNESIRIRELTDTIKIKNQHQQKINAHFKNKV